VGADTEGRWEYCLRAFFSVDLVGSTAQKVGEPGGPPVPWVEAFERFFKEFPPELVRQYADVDADVAKAEKRAGARAKTRQQSDDAWFDALLRLRRKDEYVSPRDQFRLLRPWKLNGDEIVFHAQLMRRGDLVLHLLAVQRAVRRYQEPSANRARRAPKPPLRVKVVGWLAGFPVTNRQVEVGLDGDPGSVVTEYIGPSMDIGFRLTEVADEARLLVSVEMALMLVDALEDAEMREEGLVFCSGRQFLKGVAGGVPYPELWIPYRSSLEEAQAEAELLGRQPKRSVMKAFLHAYLETQRMIRPFIKVGDEVRYGSVPREIEEARQKLMAADPSAAPLEEPLPEGRPAEFEAEPQMVGECAAQAVEPTHTCRGTA